MMKLDMSFNEVMTLPAGPEKATQLALDGLLMDGGHHKQWYLEQILIALGEDPIAIRSAFNGKYDWEDGIAP